MQKKLFLILFIAFSSSFITNGQSKWYPSASLPDSARSNAIGFAIGNYGYIGLGTSQNGAHVYYYKDLWQFDASTNMWIRKADFPGLARINPATFVIGNYAYVVTGQDTNINYLQECWQYNATTDKWIQMANFPGAPRAYDVGFSIGGKGYVGTGSDYLNHYRNDFWEYDTTINTWTQIASFGGIARFGSNGFAIGGNGYVCFGRDSTGKWHNDIWEYNPGANTWVQKSNNPGYPMFGGSGFVIGSNIYVGTGEDSVPAFLNKFWQYNTLSDTWTQAASLPGPSRDVACAFAIVDTGYLGVGFDSASRYFNSMDKFLFDSTVGIINIHGDNNISVYPDPFSSYCIISIPDDVNTADNEITLFDIMGEKQNAIISHESPNYILSKGSLPTGMYVLSIKHNNHSFYYKLIITN